MVFSYHGMVIFLSIKELVHVRLWLNIAFEFAGARVYGNNQRISFCLKLKTSHSQQTILFAQIKDRKNWPQIKITNLLRLYSGWLETGAEWKVSKIVMCFGSVIIFVHLWPYMTTGLVGRRLTVLSINFSCDGKLPQWPLAVDPCTVSNTKNLCEFKTLLYLPVYNVRPCIIRTPISDLILRKKKNKLLNTKVKLYTIIYFNELGKLQ